MPIIDTIEVYRIDSHHSVLHSETAPPRSLPCAALALHCRPLPASCLLLLLSSRPLPLSSRPLHPSSSPFPLSSRPLHPSSSPFLPSSRLLLLSSHPFPPSSSPLHPSSRRLKIHEVGTAREMLKCNLGDLLFAEKCCIFALQDRELPVNTGLPRFLFAPICRKTGPERGQLPAG